MLAIRDAFHKIYTAIPAADRSKATERERDLICTANCAVWEKDLKTIARCVRRLLTSSERSADYAKIQALLA